MSRPRLFGAAALADKFLARRSAQRFFIASDNRRRPAEVMPPCLLRLALRVAPLPLTPVPSISAAIARPIFSLSLLNSVMIVLRSNIGTPLTEWLKQYQVCPRELQ